MYVPSFALIATGRRHLADRRDARHARHDDRVDLPQGPAATAAQPLELRAIAEHTPRREICAARDDRPTTGSHAVEVGRHERADRLVALGDERAAVQQRAASSIGATSIGPELDPHQCGSSTALAKHVRAAGSPSKSS